MRPQRLALIGLILSLGAACRPESNRHAEEHSPDRPVEVKLASVERRERGDVMSLVGSVKARNSVSVSPRVMAQILAVHFDEGDAVKAGDLLVELDNRELLAALRAAEAELSVSSEAISVSQHVLESGLARLQIAEVTLKRFQDLLNKESVSQHEYDQAVSAAEEARASVAAARARQQQAVSRQQQAEAGVSSARVRLGHTRIQSPTNGIVTRRFQDPGSLGMPGQPVLVIEDLDEPRLHVVVPESAASALRLGQILPVELDALKEQGVQEGTVVEIVPEVDTGSRTFVAKVKLPELAGLRSGQYGRALLSLSQKSVLVVPREAVMERGQIRSVFVVEDARARQRLVTLGVLENGTYDVLSGLTAGELVALNPAMLTDGCRITSSGDHSTASPPTGRRN